MGLLDLFKRSKTQPEDIYEVTITDELVKVEHIKRPTESVLWQDIRTILMVNTDEGPGRPDVWLTLAGETAVA